MARIDPKRAAKVAAAGAALAVRYGPQAKIAWDKGGRQATQAAVRRAGAVRARRQATAHAAGLVDGAVLELAPGGERVWVVLSGTTPVAAYPPTATPLERLVEHADLTRAVRTADAPQPGRRLPRPGRLSRGDGS